jgi:hypothetical protein
MIQLERSLLPAAAEVIRERREASQWATLHHRLNTQLGRLRLLDSAEEFNFEALKETYSELRALSKKIRENSLLKKKNSDRTVKTHKCPKCRGFIRISVTGACDTCTYVMCRSCGEDKLDDAHACDANVALTWAKLREDYKQCPKCGISIDRVSGCSQMFCTECHTGFDWNTGRVVTGPIHNPHYFEFLRTGSATAQEAANMDCNVIMSILTAQEHAQLAAVFPCLSAARCTCEPQKRCPRIFAEIWRICEWVRAWTMHEPAQEYTERTHLELRIRFLEGSIDEKQWASKLSSHETKRTKFRRIFEVDRMFCAVARDVFQVFVNDKHVQNFLTAMEELRKYTENAKRKILEDYSDAAFRHIDVNWRVDFRMRV